MKLAMVVFLFCGSPVFAQDEEMRDLVKRGEYVSHAADCIACHTPTGEPAYSGGLKLETPFGVLYSANITPDEETGIGRWSLADFKRALQMGIGKEGQHLFPAFPYDYYTRMEDADIEALYAFLRTIPPVHKKVETNQLTFPFSIRKTVSFWKFLYFTPGRFKKDPEKSDEWNRGAYLVEGAGHCESCHTPRTWLGGPKRSSRFLGAPIEKWFASNLTADQITGLGDWTVGELVEFFKTGKVRERTTALGPMAEVQQSLSHLTDEDLKAIAIYLKSLPPLPAEAPLENVRYLAQQKRQSVLFLENCAGCHHPYGTGRQGLVPPLAGNSVLQQSPANILTVVLFGIPARNEMQGMPAFADKLNDSEIAAIINYVRRRWGQRTEAVTTEQVSGWRKKGQ